MLLPTAAFADRYTLLIGGRKTFWSVEMSSKKQCQRSLERAIDKKNWSVGDPIIQTAICLESN